MVVEPRSRHSPTAVTLGLRQDYITRKAQARCPEAEPGRKDPAPSSLQTDLIVTAIGSGSSTVDVASPPR